MAISKLVSRKISKPMTELSNFAKKIGEREYEALPDEYDDEDMDNLAVTMHDMARKLSAYDNTIKAFMQNASHELRTPMMSIQGYAEGLKLGVVEDKEAALNIIIEESKRLNLIVEDLLYLTKLDSLQESLNLEKLQLEEVLKSCIERVNGIAVKNHIKIMLSLDKNLYLMADDEKITRAIINILGNALRYAREIIRIEAKQQESKIIINIVDDGPGFEAKDLPRIFERFYKGKGGEHGLGLAITKSIIEKHGGSITAQNSENSGACFEIRL
jgi:signal transduction histidine kinase